MSPRSYQMRVCQNPACGLRYPLLENHPFGERCPACLGETRAVLTVDLSLAPEAAAAPGSRRGSVLLDNLRSAWNVGSILRSADGLGFQHAYLCGITPTPQSVEVRKTALGAENQVSWSAHRDGVKLARALEGAGGILLALETAPEAVPLSDLELESYTPEKIILVLGNERTGVDPSILQAAHRVVSIPMRGQKRSINVASAFAVAGYQIQMKMRDRTNGRP
ncbi:MAG: TrmH family RNA methyltransferase [Bacteroidota bacterium]